MRAQAYFGISVGAFVLVLAMAQAHGAYFPTAWGWCVLSLGWAAVLLLVLGDRILLGGLGRLFVCSASLVVGWTALSIVWSSDVEQSVLEVERGLIYVIGTFVFVLVARGQAITGLLSGLLTGIVWISIQALEGRLFAGTGGGSAQIVLGRLAEPVGYSNALGLLAVMAALIALGMAVHGRTLNARVCAAGALPVLLATGYFTFSRGAALALAAGLVCATLLDPRRLRLLTVGSVVALPALMTVWLASRAPGLTSISAPGAVVATEGRALAVELVVATIASAALALLVARLERRPRVGVRARLAYRAAVALRPSR